MNSQIACLVAISRTRWMVSGAPAFSDALAPVAFDQPLHGVEQVGPHRLRTQIAAPDAPPDRVHQKQRHRRDNEQSGKIIDFLRPQFDEEKIESPGREIDQHGLAGRVRPAVPAHERQDVIDRQRDGHQAPFDIAEGAGNALRIDGLAGRIERRGKVVEVGRIDGLVHGGSTVVIGPNGEPSRCLSAFVLRLFDAAQKSDAIGRLPSSTPILFT